MIRAITPYTSKENIPSIAPDKKNGKKKFNNSLKDAKNINNTISFYDDNHTKLNGEQGRKFFIEGLDPRNYPKSHDKYDLAALNKGPIAKGPKITEKAKKKYNLENLALVNEENFNSQLVLYKSLASSGGVPGYIDAFLKGEPGGRTEGYNIHPKQFCTTKFHPVHGGFIISPNPSNIPEKNQSHTNNSDTLLSVTRENGRGFGLVCYWIPPATYERSPVFQSLFPDVPVPDNAPPIVHQTNPAHAREKRLEGGESNHDYKLRTGQDFLSVPMDLRKEHTELLRELKSTIIKHLGEVYHCELAKEKVEIYSHSPIYAMNSCGLHFHVRVNEGRHALESDLRNLSIDDAISQLEKSGRITKIPLTNSGKFISYNISAKPNAAKKNGVEYELVPNPWKTPALNTEASKHKRHFNEIQTNNFKTAERSAKKYDNPVIGLVKPSDMQKRIDRYSNNEILPNFVYDFFTGKNEKKIQAFRLHPEQFPSTKFGNEGGIFLMPNPKYIKGKSEYFDKPHTIISETRKTGGIALLGYWVPPSVFDGQDVFNAIFSITGNLKHPLSHREKISEYNQRTKNDFIINPIDLRKKHVSMLKEFQMIALKNLKEVYGFDELRDKVDMYLHSPVYGDKTAGLHIHARVNQRLPAGEYDVNRLSLSRLISLLENDDVTDDEMSSAILSETKKTNGGLFYSYSAVWGTKDGDTTLDKKNEKQFNGLPVKIIPNPWKRP